MENAQTIVSGFKIHRPVLGETLTREDLRVAKDELNETPENRKTLLISIKEKLNEQTEFTPRIDDVYLLRFLRCRKFNLERTFRTIDDHYKFRQQHPDIYPSPSKIERVLRTGIFNLLPHRDHKGRAIFVIKMHLWKPDQVPYETFVAAGNLVAEYVLDNPVTQINGYIGIWDFGGFSFKHFVPFCSPKNMLTLCAIMQDRFPARFKIAYCINCHSLVNRSWSLIKSLLKDKFRKRVVILGKDLKQLHQFVDPSILPKEFGGPHPSPSATEMAERILDKETYINYNRKFGY